MITKHFGSVAASTLKNMDIERLPMLVIIQKLRGTIEINQVNNSYLMEPKIDDRSSGIRIT